MESRKFLFDLLDRRIHLLNNSLAYAVSVIVRGDNDNPHSMDYRDALAMKQRVQNELLECRKASEFLTGLIHITV